MINLNKLYNNKRFKIILWNFVFIFIIGFIRFQFYNFEGKEEGFAVFAPFVVNGILIIIFSIFLGILAKNLYPQISIKNLFKFIWPFFIYASLGSEFLLFGTTPMIIVYLLIDILQGDSTNISLIIAKFMMGLVFILLPSYFVYKSKLSFQKIINFVEKNMKYLFPLLIIIIFIFFVPFVFSINPFCAHTYGVGFFPSGEWSGEMCYTPIAALTLNSDYCANEFASYDACFMIVAGLKNDPSECLNVIYKGGLLRHNERTCLTQFFNKKDGYKACYAFERYDQGFVYECVESFVGWNLRTHPKADEKFYPYLLSLCNNISHDSTSYCYTAEVDYEYFTRLPRSGDDTLELFKKYKDVLKDENKFKNELLNPNDIDFCKLMSILVKGGTIFDTENNDYLSEDNPYEIVCYANFGKNPKAEKECSKGHNPNYSLRQVCQGGLHFHKYRGFYNYTGPHDRDNPYLLGYSIGNGPFQYGFGAVAGNTDFDLSSYMNAPLIQVKDEWSGRVNMEISGTYVDKYFEMKNFVENLQPVKFCDIVQEFKKECKEVAHS